MIKMIASDLDGTILLNGAQQIPAELYDLIRELKQLGIFFVAASGRQYANMRRNFMSVLNDIGFVCENGAIAYWKDKLLYEENFDRNVADALIRDIRSREKSDFLYSTREFYYVMPKTEEYMYLLKNVIKNDCQEIHSLDEIQLPCIKMACYEPDGATEEISRYWQEKYSDKYRVVTAGGKWVDFIPAQVDKALGIRKFMEMRQIRPEECMTFGDEFNDIEMLRCVPYGFAMAHAKQGVRESAPYVAENVIDILKILIKAKGDIQEVLKYVQ